MFDFDVANDLYRRAGGEGAMRTSCCAVLWMYIIFVCGVVWSELIGDELNWIDVM